MAGEHLKATWDCVCLYLGIGKERVFVIVQGAAREESTDTESTVKERVSALLRHLEIKD